MTRSARRSQEVYQAIVGRIESGALPNRSRLPSVTALAAAHSVSRGTVQRVLGMLESAGLVQRRRGSGVYVRSTHERVPPLLAGGSAVSVGVVQALADDVRSGGYPPGCFLPGKQTLGRRYAATGGAINAALKAVADAGLIYRRGARWLAGVESASAVPPASRTVTVLGSLRQIERMWTWRITRPFLRSFETELNRYGITEFRPIDITAESVRAVTRLTRADTVGFLYLAPGPDKTGSNTRRLERHLNAAARTGLPVVHNLHNRLRNLYPDLRLDIRENVYLVWIENRGATASMAAHLARLGHRAAAFFSHFPMYPWGKAREQGFVRGFKQGTAGRGTVKVFHSLRDRAEPAREHYGELRGRALERCAELFELSPFRIHDPLTELREQLQVLANADEFRRAMERSFAEALRLEPITAWAFEGEMQAIGALEFLREAGVDVPGRISIIACGNEADTIVHGISTYDFQHERMGYIAAHCFLGDLPACRDRRGILRVPGRLVARATTAPPRGAVVSNQ